jgi:nitrogen-specific signal transduction histidine kinase
VKVEVRSDTPEWHIPAGTSNATHPINWVAINVIDDGPGIDPSGEEKIFQPFFSTKQKKNAAGLGLNVASGCVTQIGGMLKHESKPGRARFQILLPAIR